MSRVPGAIADLTRAIELDPELAWAIAERGEAYRLMGRHEDAIADLTRAAGLHPTTGSRSTTEEPRTDNYDR